MTSWTGDELGVARSVLPNHPNLGSALTEISKKLGRKVSRSSLRHEMIRRGMGNPSDHLGETLVPRDERAASLEKLQEWIGEASRELDVDPREITRTVVCANTPARPEDFAAYGGFQKVRRDAYDEIVRADLSSREGLRSREAYIRRLEKEVGRRDYLSRRLTSTLERLFKDNPIRLGARLKAARKTNGSRLLTALVSDAHFGIEVDPTEIPGNRYDWTTAARRMALLAVQICDWKPDHRKETKLHVVLNGDLIAGRIHLDDRGVQLLSDQIYGATAILVAFFDYLRRDFPEIDVTCLPGNHERTTRERQIAQRWDSHARAIYTGLQMAFRSDKGIRFEVPRTGEGVVELPGDKDLAFYTHGDVAPAINNVGKALDIRPIVETLHRLNSSGEFKKPIRILGYGHWHQGLVMPTGLATVVVNGSVVGPDSFARNVCGVRGEQGAPMQLLMESIPGFPFGDSRFVHLRPADDDRNLDRVVPVPNLR